MRKETTIASTVSTELEREPVSEICMPVWTKKFIKSFHHPHQLPPPTKTSSQLERRNSTICDWFIMLIAMFAPPPPLPPAAAAASSAAGVDQMSVGPKHIAKLDACIRFSDLSATTLTRCLHSNTKVARDAGGICLEERREGR